VANKVGTYGLALAANAHGVPFYVAAPVSTIDVETPSGDAINIEERDGDEVLTVSGVRVAPDGCAALNPAFDVTPAALVTAIITERGVLRPPFDVAFGEHTLKARATNRHAPNARRFLVQRGVAR
jgi:methylthioribose-1-phosphate isomerase